MICPGCNTNNLPGAEVCVNCLHDLTQHDLPAANDRVERSLMEDQVAALKPRPAVCLSPADTVGRAVAVMLEHDIGAVPVVDEDGRLLGIFTERDLLTRTDLADAGDPLSACMTREPVTVRDSDTLALALHRMDSGGYRHLPVVRQGHVVGMISVRDLLRHIVGLCRTSGCQGLLRGND